MRKLIVILVLLLMGCSSNENIISTNLNSEETLNEIYEATKVSNLDHIDVFINWVKDFNETVNDSNLVDDFVSFDKVDPNLISCAEKWEATYDYLDANCRMTAFLLMNNQIEYDDLIKDYNGTYLMLDLDAIDNVKKYEVLKEKRDLFITLFSDQKREGELKDEYPNRWHKYNLRNTNDKASLISVVIYDEFDDVIFVGHTGVLIDLKDYYLFIEKIAFEQPYQATKLKSIDDLLTLFSTRQEYFGDSKGPFIYQDDKFIAELKNQ